MKKETVTGNNQGDDIISMEGNIFSTEKVKATSTISLLWESEDQWQFDDGGLRSDYDGRRSSGDGGWRLQLCDLGLRG